MPLKPDDPAFVVEGGNNNGMQPYSGMSIREYFAAKALQGLIAEDSSQHNIARQAVGYADELIDELNRLKL